VRLGINLPYRRADGSAPTAAQIMARARLLEEIGFDGIWMGDTVGRFDFAGLDTLQWLTVAAAGTTRIELGTAVIQMPLRSPVELAQRLMTLQAVSGGRFIAGLGSGSTAKDFEATGVEFSQRFKLLREGASKIKRLLAGETVDGICIHPWPNVQGGPPIVIGAWGSGQWVRRAAEEYDGWMASGFNTSLKTLREGIERYREAGGAGRTLVATVNVNLAGASGPFDPDGRFHLNCPPEEARERLAQLAELGFDDVLCSRLNYADEDWPEADLRLLRSLLPRDPRSTNPEGGSTL
jgi:alkanesulfonate monooxygenase SsuD/methylene tetrahydromethanopterin reductase-like flavin-dependent oxidoreductase (luciferase family)